MMKYHVQSAKDARIKKFHAEKLGSREKKKKKNKCMDRQSFINTSERLRV